MGTLDTLTLIFDVLSWIVAIAAILFGILLIWLMLLNLREKRRPEAKPEPVERTEKR